MRCELLAVRCNECDHLTGTVFVDRISMLKRELIRKRMKKLKAERAAEKASPQESAGA